MNLPSVQQLLLHVVAKPRMFPPWRWRTNYAHMHLIKQSWHTNFALAWTPSTEETCQQSHEGTNVLFRWWLLTNLWHEDTVCVTSVRNMYCFATFHRIQEHHEEAATSVSLLQFVIAKSTMRYRFQSWSKRCTSATFDSRMNRSHTQHRTLARVQSYGYLACHRSSCYLKFFNSTKNVNYHKMILLSIPFCELRTKRVRSDCRSIAQFAHRADASWLEPSTWFISEVLMSTHIVDRSEFDMMMSCEVV